MRHTSVLSGSGLFTMAMAFLVACGGTGKTPRRDAGGDSGTTPVTVPSDGATGGSPSGTDAAAVGPRWDGAPASASGDAAATGDSGDASGGNVAVSDGGRDVTAKADAAPIVTPKADAASTDVSAPDGPVTLDGAVAMDGAGAPPSLDAATTTPFCAATAARAARCKEQFDPPQCVEGERCLDQLLRSEVLGSVKTCVVASGCSDKFERCLVQAAAPALLANPVFLGLLKVCQPKLSMCAAQKIDARLCSAFATVLRDDVIAQVQGCYARPCTEIAACLTALESKFNCQ